jgi:hypothetical protein
MPAAAPTTASTPLTPDALPLEVTQRILWLWSTEHQPEPQVGKVRPGWTMSARALAAFYAAGASAVGLQGDAATVSQQAICLWQHDRLPSPERAEVFAMIAPDAVAQARAEVGNDDDRSDAEWLRDLLSDSSTRAQAHHVAPVDVMRLAERVSASELEVRKLSMIVDSLVASSR